MAGENNKSEQNFNAQQRQMLGRTDEIDEVKEIVKDFGMWWIQNKTPF